MFSRVFVSARLEARCVGGDVDVAGGLSIGHVSTRRLELVGYLVFLRQWRVGRRSSNGWHSSMPLLEWELVGQL